MHDEAGATQFPGEYRGFTKGRSIACLPLYLFARQTDAGDGIEAGLRLERDAMQQPQSSRR